jgi:hypothetical protein
MKCEFLMPHVRCLHPDFIGHNIDPEICQACTLKGSPNTQAGKASTNCIHLGSQRRCCDALFICRKLKQDCVKTSAENLTAVLCCETCEHFEALGPS